MATRLAMMTLLLLACLASGCARDRKEASTDNAEDADASSEDLDADGAADDTSPDTTDTAPTDSSTSERDVDSSANPEDIAEDAAESDVTPSDTSPDTTSDVPDAADDVLDTSEPPDAADDVLDAAADVPDTSEPPDAPDAEADLDPGDLPPDTNTADTEIDDAPPDVEPDTTPEEFCDPSIGATRPLRVCTPSDPCTHVSGPDAITQSSDVPTCRTTDAARPSFNDGDPIQLDVGGVARWVCAYGPQASAMDRRPLVIFMHGAHGGASNVYNSTSLRSEVASRRWYFVSVQGRNLHWPNTNGDGPHFDNFHRDLGSPSANPDIALLDQIIDSSVQALFVDPRRVYVMGWSNGGFMAQMYGIARHQTPTPGGNRVAAVAAFTAADPFHTTTEDADPSCRLATYPQTTLPIALISRACDIVACDEAQKADLIAEGFPVSPGHVVGTWVADLRGRMMNPNVQWTPLFSTGLPANRCTSPQLCGTVTATANHLRWPDGVADGSGINYEPALFDFMADHPLP